MDGDLHIIKYNINIKSILHNINIKSILCAMKTMLLEGENSLGKAFERWWCLCWELEEIDQM